MAAHDAGGVGLEDLARVKVVFPVGKESVGFGFEVHVGQQEFAAPREGFGVKSGTAGQKEFLCRGELGGFGPILRNQDPGGRKATTAEDDGGPSRQGSTDGFISLPAHE